MTEWVGDVARLRVIAAVVILLAWEAASASGLFYRGVVPSVVTIGAALARMLAATEFYRHLAVTGMEVLSALAIGASLGVAVGILVGGSRLATRAYEPPLHYLAPTPKIVFLPILIALFGVGPSSKVAMGALSCFFPMALSVASGMRQVSPVLLRVGRSFRLTRWQVVQKIVLPSLVPPIATGLRLGLGMAIIGCLLSEIKLSNRGLGFLAIQHYSQFRIPDMYALLLVVFGLAALANALVGRLAARRASLSNRSISAA